MTPTDFYPPRYRIEGFPTPEQLTAMPVVSDRAVRASQSNVRLALSHARAWTSNGWWKGEMMTQTDVRAHPTGRPDAPGRQTGPPRRTAIIVGVLFIIATAFLFIGGAIYEPILEAENVLETAFPERTTAIAGLLVEFICVMAILLIPVFLFPVLRKRNEALALGYTGFRFLEVVLFLALEANLLSLVWVSESYLDSGSAVFDGILASIRAENDALFFLYVIVFTLGALVLYTLLYQSRLVPRWLSVWGFAGAAFLLIGVVLMLLGVVAGTGLDSELIWAPPIAVQEMVMALWLIFKGFDAGAWRALPREAAAR